MNMYVLFIKAYNKNVITVNIET